MSTVGLTSSLLSQIVSSPSTANELVSGLNQIAKDLQSGNLAAAQEDYVTLSEDALNGATSSSATSSSGEITASLLSDVASSSASSTSFVNEFNQLGTDLQNGNLTSAQSDMLALDSTASSAAAGNSTSSSATQTSAASITALIKAIIQAMGAGDDSVTSSAMSELASVSSSSAGASVLQQASQGYGSSSTSSSSSSSISQLLQGLDTSSTGTSGSSLDLLA